MLMRIPLHMIMWKRRLEKCPYFVSATELNELKDRNVQAFAVFEVPLRNINNDHLDLPEQKNDQDVKEEEDVPTLIKEKAQLNSLLLIGVDLDDNDAIDFSSGLNTAQNVLSNRPIPGYGVVVTVQIQASRGVFPSKDRPRLAFEPYLIPWDDKPGGNAMA